jgi:uncharacterized protein (DUF2147 family)
MLFTSRNYRITTCYTLFCALLAPMAIARAATGEPSPVGFWRAVDDRTNKPRGIIRIYEENGIFSGRIEMSFNPEELTARCDKCSGERKNAPVIGLVIMRGITKHGAEYAGGEILDPETGSIYRCRFTLSSEGAKLFLRGYLGIPVLGRTQTWTRVETEATAEKRQKITYVDQ